ncbi:hypothetical protein CR513_14080, partial [Mucuna pruriens]
MEEKRAKVSLSLDTRMWNVITITKQGIYRSIVSCGKKENKGKKGKSKEKDHDDDDDDRVTTATNDDLTRVSFKKHPPSRKSELLELVHFDVCGPLKEALGLYFEVKGPSVPDKIWFGKDVKYDHLRVFDCKAFVHVPKDERSKLDMKSRQCIFIGYGQDEYGYRLYDLIEKKLVKSRDVKFMEDQTIEDIDKFGDDFDIPLDDDVKEEQEMSQDENLGNVPEPPPVQLKRSNRYTSDEYATLIDGEELECYEEAMESEKRQKSVRTPPATHFKLSSRHNPSNEVEKTNMSRVPHASTVGSLMYAMIRDTLDAKLLELTKVHTNDNGADMMTKAVSRGKIEACCEIARLAITST